MNNIGQQTFYSGKRRKFKHNPRRRKSFRRKGARERTKLITMIKSDAKWLHSRISQERAGVRKDKW